MQLRAHNDPDYRAYKQWLTTHVVACWYGCGQRATSPDHRPRLHQHHHQRGTGCCTLLPACQPCNSSDGATSRPSRTEPHSEQW